MRLPRALASWRSRWTGTWGLDDPRPIAARAPYTFYMPEPELLAAVQPGDEVKAIFRPSPDDRDYGAERMWVRVESVEADCFIGTLDNEPFDMPQLRHGARVRVPKAYVIDIDWAAGHSPPPVPPTRWYWQRCMVDDCVLKGRSHADYLYREEPDLTRPEDREPDSGWRIRGTRDAIDEDERLGRDPQYVALGAVLNADDRWLDLIDEPVGSTFRWWDLEARYVRCEPE